jgi:ankyrin repeat protein
MWQDQAVTEAQAMWSTTFAPFDVPWDEIKANIAYGNIAGSGCGYTLLHAFVEFRNTLAVKFLLWKGADVHAQSNANGYTPLHTAIEKHDSSMVSILLDEGADHLAQDSKGMTAWGLAIYHGDEKVVAGMLRRGANLNDPVSEPTNAVTPLMFAIERGKESVIELFVKSGAPIEATDGNGNTALINAARDGDRVTIVRHLLKLGANINASNNHGVTALMVGVKTGSEEMVQTLLERGADVEARAHDGETALLIAARDGFKPVVLLLLEHGAECVNGYPRGGTPQDVAANYSVMEPLQQARAKKKKWFKRLARDEMDEKFRSARLSELYKVYEEREMRERRQFSYIRSEEDLEQEERRETEELRRRLNSVKM